MAPAAPPHSPASAATGSRRSRFRLHVRALAWVTRSRLRPVLLAGVAGAVVLKIVAFTPGTLEEGGERSSAVEPETLMEGDEATLATGVPKGKIPEYSVEQFQYVSTQGTEKQWKLVADKAYLYNTEKIVHSRHVTAYLYDPDGKITVVRGKESKYIMNQRDLEVFGDVHTVFPDGFELVSDYLRYKPNERKIEIPTRYFVQGDGHEQGDQHVRFQSQGLDFAMASSKIILPEAVRMTFEKKPAPGARSDSDGPTVVESDHAVIHRDKQIAFFTMDPNRPLATRFVHITQPTLFTRGRRAQMNYGDFAKLVNYMVAFEDVLIKEKAPPPSSASPKPDEGDAPPSLRYATGGRADFDAKRDVIRLTEFPQAYQDNDTVTGDIIIFHRDSDLVEVEHSNAFSQGN